MRNLTEELAQARDAALLARVQAVVREEITMALRALALAAAEADMPYETGELESAGLAAVGRSATSAVENLLQCWNGEHAFEDWRGYAAESCSRCGTPRVNPFEAKLDPGCRHAFTKNDNGTRTCQICEGVKTDGTS